MKAFWSAVIVLFEMDMQNFSVSVRSATEQDATQMMQIQLNCLEKVFTAVYPTPELEMLKDILTLESYVAKTQTTGWCFVAVAETDKEEQVLGFGYINLNIGSPPRIPNWYHCSLKVENLYVDPKYHKRGIGRLLMQEMERQASDEGCTSIGILSSLPAVPFYKGLGYKDMQKSWHNIGIGTGRLEGRIMVKELQSLA